MLLIDFLLQSLLFCIALIFGFYIPGRVFFHVIRIRLTSLENLFFPLITGMMLFTLIAYALSFLKLNILILPILIAVFIFSLKNKITLSNKLPKQELKPLLFIVCSALVLCITVVTSGKFGESIQLIGVNSIDSLWHLAMIRELIAHFPPDFPGFAGVPLQGYHFFNAFLIAKISTSFGISHFYLFFQFIPLLIAYLWGIGVYALVFAWTHNRKAGLWAVFLTMFGGSFGFVMRILGHEDFNLDTGFGMNQPITSLLNPPFSISIVILIAVLMSLFYYCKTGNKRWLFLLVLFMGVIAEFKVYAAIIIFSGYFFLTFLELLKKRFALIIAGIFITILFYSTYWMYSGNYAGLVFLPLWSTHRLLDANFPWYGFSEKFRTYSAQSVIRGLVEVELFGLFVFIVGNLGTRFFGLLVAIITYLKKPSFSPFVTTLIVMTMVSILLPLFFIQSIKPFDFIQVTWYFLFLTSIMSSVGFTKLFKLNKNFILKVFLFTIIIGMTLSSVYDTVFQYALAFKNVQPSQYDKSLLYLSNVKNYDATVMEIPPKNIDNNLDALRKWYRSTSPGFIAFSNKRSFLTYQYFDFPGLDVDSRLRSIQTVLAFARLPNIADAKIELKEKAKKELIKHDITFIYAHENLPTLEKLGNSKKVFQNESSTIYTVNNL